MKTIYINGDSQTIGTGDVIDRGEGQLPYSEHLAKRLGLDIIANEAKGGASNTRIERLTLKFLWECEAKLREYPDFILIGWSEPQRVDGFANGEYISIGQEFSVYSDGYDEPNKNAWFKYVREETCVRRNLQMIYNMHCKLKYLRIPHLFVNGQIGFNDHTGRERGLGIESTNPSNFEPMRFDWEKRFWNPYGKDCSFTSWAFNAGYKNSATWHVEHDAHVEFADVLYNHIRRYSLL